MKLSKNFISDKAGDGPFIFRLFQFSYMCCVQACYKSMHVPLLYWSGVSHGRLSAVVMGNIKRCVPAIPVIADPLSLPRSFCEVGVHGLTKTAALIGLKMPGL